MQNYLKSQLPANISCQQHISDSIYLSTTIFIPKTYTPNAKHKILRSKNNKRYIRINFTIPSDTPINQLYIASYNKCLQSTKQIRLSIAKHKLALQLQNIKSLRRI